MKGVLEISGTSRYDDLIAERYHFPRIYLRPAQACLRCIHRTDKTPSRWKQAVLIGGKKAARLRVI